MSMSVVYFKFKSCKEFSSLPISGQYISVGSLKETIFELKRLGRGKDIDLVVSDAQTNQEYTDDAALIPRYTSVLIRRVPGQPRMRIRAHPEQLKCEEENTKITQDVINVSASLSRTNPEESEWYDFGNDPFAILPEGQTAQLFNQANVSSSGKVEEEERKLQALVETSTTDLTSKNDQPRDRGYGHGIGARRMGGPGFGYGLLEHRKPPPGYVCHRCNQPGHFIQHCSTNGNPAYDRKRFKPPTGIPKSMLMTTPDGCYTTPGGDVAVLRPNKAAFEKAIEGIPTLACAAAVSTEFPEELCCPICKEIMKDAVLSKCCFDSYCDKCIRDFITKESKCVCGSRALLDDLVPNKTLRRTINQVQDMSSSSAVSSLTEETKDLTPGVGCSLEGARERWEDSTGIITKEKQPHDSHLHSPPRSKKRCFQFIST